MDISAVIPTRNRKETLFRLLNSLDRQEYRLKEVVIIDSSDDPLSGSFFATKFPRLPIVYRTSKPSVCLQRNLGIQLTTSSHVFLCEDDLEVPGDYLSTIIQTFRTHPEIHAISGLCFEPDSTGKIQYSFPTIKLKNLLWHFMFQLTVWADLSKIQTNALGRPLLSLLQQFYRYKGNTYSLAGWPLVTQVDAQLFRTSLFSLGGSVIRRDWLVLSPYDERLDPHGIGDNYGVALNFPQNMPIVVNTEVYVIHHKARENRLSTDEVYLRRILALDYFMARSRRFSLLNRCILVWSLVGNLLYQTVKRQRKMGRATLRAFELLLMGRNPYLSAQKENSGNELYAARDMDRIFS